MGSRVDASGEPARDDEPECRKFPGKRSSPVSSAAGSSPSTDYGDLWTIEHLDVAAAVEHRRRTRDGGQSYWVQA